MPLKDIFQKQIDQLRAFLDAPGPSMRIVQYDSDLKPVLARILVVLEEDEESPHLLWGTETAFDCQAGYFQQILKDLVDANESCRSELSALGVELPAPPADEERGLIGERFVGYLDQVAESLPDSAGAYVIVIDPEEIDDIYDYREALYFLANGTESSRVKYLVPDQRPEPLLTDFDRYSGRISIQDFHLSPEQIEAQIADDFEHDPSLDAAERGQYAAMMGTFAFVRGDYNEAERIQLDVLDQSLETGDPGEQALAYYNLGNTYLGAEEFELAEQCFTCAGERCLEARIEPLLAISLTNLGVALYWRGYATEAGGSFDTARRIFQATGNPAGVAYSLDCKAYVLAASGRRIEAEKAWLEALRVYDGMDGEALRDVRFGGRREILGKLKEFYNETGQPHKILYLKEKASLL